MSSSLTVLGTACNDVLSAETVAMVKEHVIESLGRGPVWTIGEGGSGGSVQAQMIAQNYPRPARRAAAGGELPRQLALTDYPDCRLLNATTRPPTEPALTDAQRERDQRARQPGRLRGAWRPAPMSSTRPRAATSRSCRRR